MACRTVERDSRAVCTELAQCDAIAPGWSDAGREGAGPRAMGAVCRHAEPAHGAGAAVQERDRGRCNAVDSVGKSEEHTSELQYIMRISYAVFCLKKTKNMN